MYPVIYLQFAAPRDVYFLALAQLRSSYEGYAKVNHMRLRCWKDKGLSWGLHMRCSSCLRAVKLVHPYTLLSFAEEPVVFWMFAPHFQHFVTSQPFLSTLFHKHLNYSHTQASAIVFFALHQPLEDVFSLHHLSAPHCSPVCLPSCSIYSCVCACVWVCVCVSKYGFHLLIGGQVNLSQTPNGS